MICIENITNLITTYIDKCTEIELKDDLHIKDVDKLNNGSRMPKNDTKKSEKKETLYKYVTLSLFDAYSICHVTKQDHLIDVPCKFMGGSSSRYVSTLISLVTKGILIVKRKNASPKHESYN